MYNNLNNINKAQIYKRKFNTRIWVANQSVSPTQRNKLRRFWYKYLFRTVNKKRIERPGKTSSFYVAA